jgi:hypothetical protein
MKVKEVPQDGRRMLQTTLVNYAEDEKGKLVPVASNGWDLGYVAGHNIKIQYIELAEEAKERVKKNEISPLEYFMYRASMDIDILAGQMGISKRKVRKHLNPREFDKLDDEIIRQYSIVLHTDPDTIKNFKKSAL